MSGGYDDGSQSVNTTMLNMKDTHLLKLPFSIPYRQGTPPEEIVVTPDMPLERELKGACCNR